MKSFLRSALSAIAAIALVSSAVAQTPAKPRRVDKAVEATVDSIVLPSSVNGTVVMKACQQCALKSYPVTAATRYYLYDQPVTLAELTEAVAGHPKAYVGVMYSPTTGEVTEVQAHARRARR